MGCLSTPQQVIPAEDPQLPFCEWFDWRPLPVIEGKNTTDLKLLGVLDHRPEFQGAAALDSERPVSADGPPPPALPDGP